MQTEPGPGFGSEVENLSRKCLSVFEQTSLFLGSVLDLTQYQRTKMKYVHGLYARIELYKIKILSTYPKNIQNRLCQIAATGFLFIIIMPHSPTVLSDSFYKEKNTRWNCIYKNWTLKIINQRIFTFKLGGKTKTWSQQNTFWRFHRWFFHNALLT